MNKFTAQELRQIAEKVEVNVDGVLLRMKATAEAGETQYWHYDALNKKQVEYLQSLGYKIEYSSHRNEDQYRISW